MMSIWSSEIKELERLYESFKGQLPELEKEVGQLIKSDDPNVILLYSRRCLEVIITELCEYELKRQRGTEPLKGIIDKLNKEKKIPGHIASSMYGLNDLSTYGTHPKDFEPEQVKPVLNNLVIIIKWHLKYKETKINITGKSGEAKNETLASNDTAEKIQTPKKRVVLLLSGITLVVAIVVVALFVFNIIGGGNRIKELEKSIAVLPFFNDSQDQENAEYINGIMDEILNNLQRIKEFRVPSRTSTEQYRGESKPSIPEIARQLDVNYIIEGSGQKYGNTIRLRVQLIVVDKGKESHLWGESYEQDISDAKNYFLLQSRIAESIAEELKTIITPEERELIEKTSTTDLEAFILYQKGRESFLKFLTTRNRIEFNKSNNYFRNALKSDSLFAPAYAGLASNLIYEYSMYYNNSSESLADSIQILVNKALSLDNQLPEAYYVRGLLMQTKGNILQAIDDLNKALEINPNYAEAYRGFARLYSNDDLLKTIEYGHEMIKLERGSEFSFSLFELAQAYSSAGFIDFAKKYCEDALKINEDSSIYLVMLGNLFWSEGNYNESIKNIKEAYFLDSTNGNFLYNIVYFNSLLGQAKEGLEYFEKYAKVNDSSAIDLNELHRIGYLFWKNGDKKHADFYLDMQLQACNSAIQKGNLWAQKLYPYYDIASIYALRGNKEKAYENLRILNRRETFPLWMVSLIKFDPLFGSIRNEPEFQQIVRDVEDKYHAEHERVRKWLEENDML